MVSPRTRLVPSIAVPIVVPIVLCGLLMLGACGNSDDEPAAATSEPTADSVTVSEATSMKPVAGQSVAAVYALVHNHSDADVTIVRASSPITDTVELDETVDTGDGQMTMRPVADGFVVPAGGEFRFELGGPHVMLRNVNPATFPSDTLDVTLTFADGTDVAFTATVTALDGSDPMAEMPMDEMPMDEMPMGTDAGHAAFDGHALHELDEQLAGGTLDADTQRDVVAGLIAALDGMHPADDSPQTALRDLLERLDQALADGDLATASDLATQAHEAAHDIDG